MDALIATPPSAHLMAHIPRFLVIETAIEYICAAEMVPPMCLQHDTIAVMDVATIVTAPFRPWDQLIWDTTGKSRLGYAIAQKRCPNAAGIDAKLIHKSQPGIAAHSDRIRAHPLTSSVGVTDDIATANMLIHCAPFEEFANLPNPQIL